MCGDSEEINIFLFLADLNVTNNAAIQTQATNSPIVTTHQSNGFGLKNYSSTSHSIEMSSIGVKPNKNFTKSTVNNSGTFNFVMCFTFLFSVFRNCFEAKQELKSALTFIKKIKEQKNN